MKLSARVGYEPLPTINFYQSDRRIGETLGCINAFPRLCSRDKSDKYTNADPTSSIYDEK